jgi:hypothetical protein
MALDNFTLHRYRVIAETPKGDPPGTILTETEDMGDVLIAHGWVERLPDDDPRPAKGTYTRRDLRAAR